MTEQADRIPEPPLLAALGGKQGLVDGAVAPVSFVAVNSVAGLAGASDPLGWAIGASLATGLGIVAVRAVSGSTLGGGLRGLVGLALALGFAAWSGQARAFFLPGIVVDAVYALVFAGSVLVRRPLVGHVYAAVFRLGRAWREVPRIRRMFVLATLGWSAVFTVRAGATGAFYYLDQPELLGLAKVALGWPLTGLALALTLAAARRTGVHRCPPQTAQAR